MEENRMPIMSNFHLRQSVSFLRSQCFSGFVSSIGSKIDPDASFASVDGSRNRVFTTVRTFWLFLYQVLMGNLSLDAMVQVAKAWLLEAEDISISSNTSAFSQARSRLPTEFLRTIDCQVRENFPESKKFHGFSVKLVDGTGISVPDTPENRERYPKHGKAGTYSGFPSFKLVGLFDYESGKNIEWSVDTISTSDSALFRLFWPLLNSDDLIVGDRHFCGFAYFAFLLNLGVNMMTRKHQMRRHQTTEKQIGKHDLIVKWEKPLKPPKWLGMDEWEQLPESLLIREIKFTVRPKGFRTNTITITTTVLEESISAEEWAELYLHRWNVELFLRDIKTTLGMDMLKGKKPEIIDKEIFLYFIAYNLIRLLILEAATKNNADLSKISFKSTITAIQIWAPMLAEAETESKYERYFDEFLKMIAYPRCRNRKNRTEPRARKRRPKNYQLLTGERHLFKPIPHRNSYKRKP
jgi:hypothetical protein